MLLIVCTGAMVSIKNYRGIVVTATHTCYVQSAYFSICGILWPSELVKQPFKKQALIYLLAAKMVELVSIRSPIAVVAKDSGVFQLLVHHADPAANDLYMVAANIIVCVTAIAVVITSQTFLATKKQT